MTQLLDSPETLLSVELEETAAAPPITEEALAWSDVVELELPERASWRATGIRAATLLAVCAAAAVLLVWGWRAWHPQHPTHPVAAPAAATTAPEPIHEPTAPVLVPDGDVLEHEVPPSPDTIYLNMVNQADAHWPTDAEAIRNGHLFCEALNQGYTRQYITDRVVAISPGVTTGQASTAVSAAITAYCPQYQK